MNEPLVVAVAFVDVLGDLLGEQLRGLDVGSILQHAIVRKFALGGGGALSIVMVGHYMRKADVVVRLLSTGGMFLMLVGGLSLLGVVDVNVARVARVLRQVMGA